jgi:hypothetical protein
MDDIRPLFGVAILALVLTGNYFLTAWRMGILRAFGRRHSLSCRMLLAGSLAGCLPLVGSLVALSIMPSGAAGEPEISALLLTLQLSLCGLSMHLANDALVQWGMAPPAAT